jgi:hypothetical protein
MAQKPPEPPKRLFPRQRFTSKIGKEWKIRTPLDKFFRRAIERIPVKGTINGEPFNAKLEFKTHPDWEWFWDVDIDPVGYYEIFLGAQSRYQLRKLPIREGMKVEVDFVYDPAQYPKDEIARQKTNARAARKREEKRKAEAAAKRKKKKA